MSRVSSTLISAVLAGVISAGAPPSPLAEERTIRFQELPTDIRSHVNEVRRACKELDPDFKPYDDLQGVTIIDLTGDGSRDLMVDNEELCNSHIAGANCNNRGCDLIIWKEVDRGSWKKIFKEHLHRKFISVHTETSRFQLMAVSIYAGDPRCKPRKEYTSGQSCDLLVSYRNGQWQWELIR